MSLSNVQSREMKATEAIASMHGRSLQTGSIGMNSYKLIVGGLAFVLLTVGIFWYQFSFVQAGSEPPRWDQLQWSYLLLILLCLPVETLASGTRIWVICRILRPGTSLWTCIKAEWANVAVSMLTPSQTGGGPAQVYILSRDGVNTATAVTISLLSFVGTMTGLLCMGLYSVIVSGISDTGPLFTAAVWTLISISTAMILAGICPGLFRVVLGSISRGLWKIQGERYSLYGWWPGGDGRTDKPADRLDRFTAKLVDLIYNYRNDMRRFLRIGKMSFTCVCLLSVVFLFSRCFIPYLCIRFLGIDASSLRHIIEVQMALIFLVFFVPTPGGAGLAEGASLSIMAEIVPIGFAPYYNLLWRFATLYLAAIAGLFCLASALRQDARRFIRNSDQK